jgi:hypothetical protein
MRNGAQLFTFPQSAAAAPAQASSALTGPPPPPPLEPLQELMTMQRSTVDPKIACRMDDPSRNVDPTRGLLPSETCDGSWRLGIHGETNWEKDPAA